METVESNLERLRKLREKILEYVDFTISEVEQENRKHEGTPTEVQEEEDFKEEEE